MEEMITIPKKVYETERKMRFFDVEPKDIYNRQFNIFIGISITNKKLTPNMAYNYLEWALKNTREKIAIIIADELNVVNYEVLDRYNSRKAFNKAKRVGDEFEKLFRNEIVKFSEEEQRKVNVYRWKDIICDLHFLKLRDIIEEEYKKDNELKSAILYFVKKLALCKK